MRASLTPSLTLSLVGVCISLMDAGPEKRKCGGTVVDPAHAAPGALMYRASFLFFGGWVHGGSTLLPYVAEHVASLCSRAASTLKLSQTAAGTLAAACCPPPPETPYPHTPCLHISSRILARACYWLQSQQLSRRAAVVVDNVG